MLTGISFWAHSVCRSTFALYREIGRQAGVPIKVAVWKSTERGACGFSVREFADMDIVTVGDDREAARIFLEATHGYLQVFSTYQVAPAYRWAIARAKERGERIVAYAEAPSNMECGWRRMVKELYLRFVLPHRSHSQIAAFEWMFCASGDNVERALRAGWPRSRIVPFGYAVPPIDCSDSRPASQSAISVLRILSTGILSWHRGPDVLVMALDHLKRRGVAFEAVMTQDGPMRGQLEKIVSERSLPVRFVGCVSPAELVRLYRSCDVFVAAGREEPWGMRVNDAINCGAPIVVSDGIGAAKIVADTGCGCIVPAGDAAAISDCLERMADDPIFLQKLKSAVPIAARLYSVRSMAARFLEVIRQRGFCT